MNFRINMETVYFKTKKEALKALPTGFNLFFDIEIYQAKCPQEFLEHAEILQSIKTKIQVIYKEHTVNFIVLESHSDTKKSYHLCGCKIQMGTTCVLTASKH